MPTLTNALRYVAKRVWVLLQNDTDLRTRLSEFAHAILKRAEHSLTFLCPTSPEDAIANQVPDARKEETPVAPAEDHEAAVALPSESPASTAINIAATRPTRQSTSACINVTDSDLPLIEARCRLKAESTRWAGKPSGADIDADIFNLTFVTNLGATA